MTTKNPARPRKPRAKKPKANTVAPQGIPAGLPPLLQVADTTLPNGQIVIQFVFTVPVDDDFTQAMVDNFGQRLLAKRSGLTVPKLVIPKGVKS